MIASTLSCSWLAMQVVHEFGHVLHAWSSGGTVALVVLLPLEISRTDISINPHPQFVAWGGPIWGSLIPLGIWVVGRQMKWPRLWLATFFAGFCLIANGAYLLAGSVFPVGDAEVLLREGAPRAALAGFGASALTGGLWFWNGIGAFFGLGRQAAAIDRQAVWYATGATTLLVAVEWLVASR